MSLRNTIGSSDLETTDFAFPQDTVAGLCADAEYFAHLLNAHYIGIDYYDRSHEDKSLPFFGGDDTVREILGTTPHLKASKDEIRAFFEATADENARISYIKRIFNNDYTEVILSDGRRVGYKTYQNVLQLWEGSYLSRTAQSFYDWGVIAQHFEAMRLLGELQDTMKPLPSIDGQLSLMTAGAEERKPSAFTFSQEIIDAVLTRGSGISEGKMRIYEQFQKSLSAKENADFLKNEYGWGGVYPAIVGANIDEQHDGKGIRISKGIGSDKPHIDLKWSQVEKRIAELIKLDRYLNPKEKAQYVKEWLDKHIEEANRDIRFIDSHYKELFRIPDGERIIVTDRDGKTESYPCRYIDNYHTEIGRNLFHICEFAERMEQGGCTYAPMEPPLPPMCYSILPSTGEVIQIDRWQKGYTATRFNDGNRVENEAIKDKFNEKLGVTKAQEQAMLAGSMIRWDSIAAKPKSYDENGKAIKPKDYER